METVHHRSHAGHVVDDDGDVVLKTEEEQGARSRSRSSSLDDRYDMSINESLDFSKSMSSNTQSKKELYIKLDEILITSLHENFEVFPGATVDRVEMVEFLSQVVRKNLPVCPDLQKIMGLRDTVLTARVKRAFPDVEYKRKQIRQDHFRKAWLYVNIRRKQQVNVTQDSTEESNTTLTVRLEAHQHIPVTKTSISTTGIWTPEIPKPPTSTRESIRRQTPLNSQLPSIIEHRPTEPPPDLFGHENKQHDKNYRKLMPLTVGGTVGMVADLNPHDKTAVVLDNYTIIKWVKMNYVEDSTSYVPVQDVVKAFKTSYGVDITYKECHQMIYSAFTSPRQRTCPLKTVRVSSMGAQYVYRGIAPVTTDKADDFDEDIDADESPSELVEHGEQQVEVWQKLVEELKHERDQSIMDRDQSILDRNQALSALMDLEKEHAKALTLIDQLRKDLAQKNHTEDVQIRYEKTESSPKINSESHNVNYSSTRAESKNLASSTCDKCTTEKQAFDYIKEDRERIWRDIVKRVTLEREEARKRLEVAKKERDTYLERLHNFEKENQRLKDSVAITPCLQSNVADTDFTTIQAIKLENRAQALRNSITIATDSQKGTNSRDNLSSVLSHLRSKRKQSTPTKFSKVPRHSTSDNDPISVLDIGSLPQENIFNFEKFDDKSQDPARLNTDDGEVDSSPERSPKRGEILLHLEGSDMIAFKPHPLDDLK